MASGSGRLVLVAVAALTSACASTGAVPRPFPVPGAVAPARAGANPSTRSGERPSPSYGSPGRNAGGSSTPTRSPVQQWHCAGRGIATAAAIRPVSTAVASRSTSSGSTGSHCLADVKNQYGIGRPVSSDRDRGRRPDLLQHGGPGPRTSASRSVATRSSTLRARPAWCASSA